MARYAKFFSLGGGGGTNNLQLPVGTILDTTLRQVQDGTGTGSPLYLSTDLVQINSTLRITTADNPYIDAEDGAGNNRFTIGRDPLSQQVNVDFASNPLGSTTMVGAIRTYQDGVNLTETMQFREDGSIFGKGTQAANNLVIQQSNDVGNLYVYNSATWGLLTTPPSGSANTTFNGRIIGTHGGAGNSALALGTIIADTSGSNFNLAIGQASTITTAQNGLAIGRLTSITNWSNATAIGYGAIAGANNAVAIGDSNALLQIGGNFTPTARVHVRGTGSTSATTSLLVQNSAGSAVLTTKNDLSLVVNDWSNQKITFTSIDSQYSQIDFGNTLDTRRAFIRGGRNAQYLFIGFPDFPNYGTQFTPTLVSIGRSKDAPTPLRVNGTPAFFIADEGIIQVNGALNTTNSGAKLAFLCGDDNSDSPVDSGGILMLKTNTFGTGTNTRMLFYNRQGTTLVERMRIADSGNVLIATTTDSGYKLDVNGTARVTNLRSGSFYPASPLDVGIAGTGFMATFQYGAVAGGGSLFFVRAGAAAGAITSSRYENYDLVLGAGNFGSTLGIAIRPANVGGVKIGGDNTTVTHVDSAILNVESTTKGFLPPRMTTTQKNAITAVAEGLIVHDTTNNGVAYYDGTNWGYLSGAKQNLTGSGGTLNIPFRNGNIVDLALNASTTLTFASHVVGTYIIEVTQGGGGSNTLTYPASVKWSGGTPPTLTTAVGKTDILTFFHDGTFFYGTYSLNY